MGYEANKDIFLESELGSIKLVFGDRHKIFRNWVVSGKNQ